MTKTRFAIAAAFAVSFIAGGASAEETTVRIQDYSGVGNKLMRVAASRGYCEKRGIKCELQIIPAGPLGVQALLANSIQVAFLRPEVVIKASLSGATVKIITSAAQRNGLEIVARNDLDIPDGDKDYRAMMTALKGKKIGVPARGSGAELQFALLAQKADLKPGDFTFVAVGSPETSLGALKSGQIDASMTFDPSALMCDVLKDCKTVYRAALAPEPREIAATNGAWVVHAVTQDMIDKSPKTVAGLIAAIKEAETFIQDPANFLEVVKIAKRDFEFKVPKGDEVIEASLRSYILTYKAHVSRDALKQIADNMLATDQLKAPFDTSIIVYDKAP